MYNKRFTKSDSDNCGCCLLIVVLFIAGVFIIAGLLYWALTAAFPDANISFWGIVLLSVVLGLIVAFWR